MGGPLTVTDKGADGSLPETRPPPLSVVDLIRFTLHFNFKCPREVARVGPGVSLGARKTLAWFLTASLSLSALRRDLLLVERCNSLIHNQPFIQRI
eukprot:6179230-Pleurochrysis_carterae.AAC.2